MNWQHHSKNNTIKSVPVCCLYWCTPYFELMEHSFVSDKQTHCTQCCGFLHRQALPIFTLEKDSIYRLSNLCTHKEGNGHKSRAKNTTRDAEVIAIVILFCRWNMGGRIKFWQGIGSCLEAGEMKLCYNHPITCSFHVSLHAITNYLSVGRQTHTMQGNLLALNYISYVLVCSFFIYHS